MDTETSFWSGVSFLWLWAMMGPILVGAVSACWNRKSRKEEREHAEKREQESRASLLAEKSKTNLFEIEKQNYELTKQLIVKFLAELQQYASFIVKDITESVIKKNPADLYAGENIRHNLTNTLFELKILLTNPDLIEAIEQAQTAVLEVPPYDVQSEKLGELLRTYGSNLGQKIHDVTILSKTHLGELESNLHKLL